MSEQIKKKLENESDVLEMNRKFVKVDPKVAFPNELYKIMLNYKTMFK